MPNSDWAQWGGPQRNFKSATTGIATSWPATGPRKLWSRELGDGCIAVEGGKFFMMYRKGKQDIVVALAPPTPDGLTIHAKAALMNSNSWTFPALAGTTLYVRDRKTIAAVDLKASGE